MGLPIIGPHSPMPMLTNGAQYVTVNEAREANGLPPLDSALGNAKTLRGPVQTCVDAECELCGVLFKGRPTIMDGEDLWLCDDCSVDVNSEKPPRPPNPPKPRLVKEGGVGGECPECHSSVTRKYWLWGYARCISCPWHGEGRELWNGYKAGGIVERRALIGEWDAYSTIDPCFRTTANPGVTTGQLRRSFK